MDALKDLLSRPPANKIEEIQTVTKPKNPLQRTGNGQFVKKIPEEEFIESLDSPKDNNRILNPKIAKMDKKPQQRVRKGEFQNYKLTGLGFPQKIETAPDQHQQWSIPVTVKNKTTERKYTKNVRFGNVNDEDYLNTGDEIARIKFINRAAPVNFLDAKFYRVYLLNSRHRDIYDACKELKQLLNV